MKCAPPSPANAKSHAKRREFGLPLPYPVRRTRRDRTRDHHRTRFAKRVPLRHLSQTAPSVCDKSIQVSYL